MTQFKIPAFSHSVGFNPSITFNNSVTFEGILDATCLYDVNLFQPQNRLDINKVYGISMGLDHNVHSARLGWRCLDGKTFELMTYIHDNGPFVPNSEIILAKGILPGQKFKCTIRNSGYFWYFKLNDGTEVEYKKSKKPSMISINYFCNPYFGGNEVLDHDSYVYINRI